MERHQLVLSLSDEALENLARLMQMAREISPAIAEYTAEQTLSELLDALLRQSGKFISPHALSYIRDVFGH